MQYLLLIYQGKASPTQPGSDEFNRVMAGHNAFAQEAQQRGILAGGNALMPPSTATTVRVESGKTTVTDGPFAETKEYLGGYYVLNARDLDEALEFARKLAPIEGYTVEVRPIIESM